MKVELGVGVGVGVAVQEGVTRAPFTSFVLVLEMTDRHSAIFPMMVAALAAEAAGRFVQRRGFYELAKERFLEKDGGNNHR